MNTRTQLLCLLVVLAGCSDPMGSETPTMDERPESTTIEPLPDTGFHPGLTADVDIRNDARRPVHLRIVETNVEGRGLVLNRTYTGPIRLDREGIFRPNGDYRVTIRINGTVRWKETVPHYALYDLRIHPNGTVAVTEIVVA